ncbi:hypothetical protein [Flagellimonas aequoris]|uniref:Fibronectin type-III domain-containing protein n=1 Tax=Flagellimonas aequoris TaxID=2306997 RepID=A0A418N6D3_9FLAO|nr:hypothetical protein [Allomuricauda aequoris]RIV69885.1 hypothetical protein D2U88_12095 [Allomuricauda aequoris]TXK01472.1 hypothetical protein FQ019_11985 [Allomuricauda aequoris]
MFRKVTLSIFVLFVLFSCSSDSAGEEEPTAVVKLPTVNSVSAISITDISAVVGGNVTSDGGASVSARGVAWGVSSNPTVAGTKTTNGTGTGEFSASLSGLQKNTQYYFRAYAINSKGTAYGSEITFTTNASLAELTTKAVTEITENSAQSGGEIVADGGKAITSRGICWSTTTNPTIDDNKTVDGEGVGSFDSAMSNLLADTEYFVRAYATNSEGTVYGNELSFITSAEVDKIYEGDIILRTQQEVDDFGVNNYIEVTGMVSIGVGGANDISNVDALSDLKSIGKDLIIYDNDNLGNLDGLSNLTSIQGDLTINFNDVFTNIDGLGNLISVTGDIEIAGNDSLQNIQGLSNLESLGGGFSIRTNNVLSSLNGFPGLTAMNGSLTVQGNGSLTNLDGLESTVSVNGNLIISNEPQLTNIDGIANVATVDNLLINNTGITVLNNLNVLESVQNDLRLTANSQLSSIQGFSSLTSVEGIYIQSNALLESISGFDGIISLEGDLFIKANSSLYDITAFPYLTGVSGSVDLSANKMTNLQFMSSVTAIEGGLYINYSETLLFLTGLENLTEIGGALILESVPLININVFDSLITLGGLTINNNQYLQNIEFPVLTEVKGNVSIMNNLDQFFNLDTTWNIDTIGGNLIIYQNNPSMANFGLLNLNAFQNLASVNGNIEITNNVNLSDYCSLQSLVVDGGLIGNFTAVGNDYNPTAQNIIDGNCSN